MAIIRANSKEAYELAARRAPEAAEKAKKKREEWEEKYKDTVKTPAEKSRSKASSSGKKTLGTSEEKSLDSYFRSEGEKVDRVQAGLAVRRAPKALSSRGSAGIAQMADRGMGNMSNLGRARNFEEYMQLRKEEENAQGMQRAAEKLLAQNNTGTGVMFGKTEREREEEAQAAADLREMQYGYKRLGDKAVFVTPFSPLPKSTKENTLTKAEAPAAFGITPYEYVNAMKTVDEGPQTSEEAKDFLDTYFWGNRMPTTEEYDAVYERLYNDPNVPDEEVRYFWWEGQRLLMEMENDNREYDAAMSLLGENAEEYAGGTEADYLSRYMQPKIYGQISAQEAAERYQQEYEVPGIGQSFDEHDATMQSIMNRGKENPYSGTSLETGATLLQKNMTDEQAQTYMEIAAMYGENAAQMYYDSLLKNGFNQKAYEIREEALRQEANDAWFGSTLKTFLNVPGQVAGTMYSIGQGLKGEEIDPYDIAYMPSQAVQTPRDEVSQMITANYGKTDEETGESKDSLLSWLMKAGYNAYTSSGDSLMAGLLGARGAGAATALQGLWQMGGSVQDATMRGGDTEQALLYGGISAAIEAITEYLPMEKLTEALESQNVRTVKDILKMAAAGAISEAPGEGLSELGNAMADRMIMQEMSRWSEDVEQLGTAGAAKKLAGDVLTSAFVGAISGAGSNTLAATGTYGINRMLYGKAESVETKSAEANATEPDAPVQTPSIQEESKKASEAAQEGQRQAQTAEVKEEQGQKEKPSIGAENAEIKGEAFKNAKTATYAADGQEGKLRVLGIASVSRDGRVMLEAETESGERELVNAADVTYDDAVTDELMAYGASERMDARGLRSYLEGYDQSMATAEEYANAFSSIYSRARSGMDFEQAALGNSVRSAMTQDAMIAAYMAGEAQYMTENNVLNAKEQKFQKKMLNVLNRYAGGKITLTKQDIGGNALYNRQTGEILISTNAQRGAYAYYAVHELGHKLKAENAQQWTAFQELVMDALDRNGVDVSELMQHEAEKFEQNGMQYDDDLLLEEVICNNAAGILQDEAVVRELIQKDRSLMERVADWLREFIDKMSRAMQDAGRDMSELGSWQGLQALKNDHESLKAIYESLMEGLEGAQRQDVSDTNVVKMSAKEKEHYDISKPFAEQVEDLFAGRFPEKNALLVSGTPEVLQKIGFSNLPMTINQEHLLNMERDTEHYLSNEMIKQLPELMKDPIAIITSSSEENKKASIVMILKAIVNGKPYIAPVYITSESRTYNARLDSNNIATVFRKGNAVSNMMENAVQKENAGEIGVYYWNKTEARNLYERAGVQFSGRSIQDGLIHSIFDAGSPVNVKYLEQTETKQFQRWFANSQIVNEDGSPKVMYRGGGEEINVFDRKKSKASNLYGRGFYFTDSETHAKQYGDARSYYLRIENPLSAESGAKNITQKQMRAFLEAVAEDEDYGLDNYGYGASVDSVLKELKGKADFDALQDINATAIGDFVAAIELFNEVNGTNYDGIITPTETVVFDSRQIKSATDNVGTFDPSNPDIRFSLREDSEGNELSKEQQEYFANSKVRDENGRLKIMYHGTANEFTVFNPMLQGGKNGTAEGYGIYFTDTASITDSYGGKRLAGYLNITQPATSTQKTIKRPALVKLIKATCEAQAKKFVDDGDYDTIADALKDTWVSNYEYTYDVPMNTVYQKVASSIIEANDNDMSIIQEVMAGNAIRSYEEAYQFYDVLKSTLGIDGFITEWENSEISNGKAIIALALDSNQFKNIDNKAPTSNPDIRFSLRETDDNIQNALAAEEKAMMQVKAHRITAMEADKLAGKALQKANSDYDRQEVASRIARTIDLMERGEDVDMRQVDDEMTQLAADIMTKSRTLDLEHEERAKPVRDYLRTTAIRLTEGQRAEAESMSGSYGAYRKSMSGRVRLSGRGMMLDQAWQELNALDAEWFPANAREGDMPALLMAAVDESKPVFHSGMGMNVEESANWLAGEMMQEYFALPAVKAAAKDARTFGDSVRDLVKAMKSFEETSWSEYQNSLQAIRSARNTQQRTKKQEETAALRAKYQSWRERDTAARREREQASKYRGRIENKTGSLLNWLEKPTETKHIPAAVEGSVRELLKTLDFTGKNTKVATELARRLEGIAKSMETAQNNEEGTMYFEQDQQMIDEIKTLAEKIGLTTDRQQMEGRGIYDLNSEELKDLDKWLGVIKHVLTDAGKLKGTDLAEYNSLDEVQGLSVMEIRQKTPLKDKHKALKAWEKYFGPDMMDSFTFFERLGPTATRVFMGLRSGFDENVRLLAIAEEYSKTLFAELKLEELTGKKAKKEKLKLSDGTEVEMTRGEMISIYLLSRRKQARGHMYKEEKGEGIKLDSDEDPDPHVLTKADEEKIAGKLTKQEKRVADGMQRFLSRECAGWGNTASMKLLGYKKFVEEHYWPIRTDSSTHNSSRLEQNFDADINAVIHQGMTKQTVENANNAIVIEDAFDTFTRHISNMAAYSAYAVPMSDFNKWYGNTELKRSILKAMGPKGQEYIKNLIIAINGSRRAEERSGIERKMAMFNRNAKAASVGANARVAIQQPTSYARAAAYMNPKYLSGALAMKKPDDALMYRYCPIARWKDWGFRETNVGPNLKELLTGKKTGMAWLQDKSMALAAKGDMWTMRRLWCACELETKALYGYKEGSEAYYRQVGKRMSELMDRTQVVDSVFHRSQMMRSKSWLAQTLTNFMSEPTKTFNLLVSATYEWAENRKNKAARARLARTYGVWVATAALTSAAAALVDAFRDDEDEKDWLEKYVSAFWDNTLESLRPSGMLPGVKEVLSIVQGYSPSRMDLQSVQRVMWAFDAVKKHIQGEGTQNLYGVVYKVAQAGSSFTGLPVSNVMRDINGVIQTATGTSLTLKESSSEKRRQRVGMIYDALLEKDKATAQKQREALKNKGGATDKEIDTMLAEFLLDHPKVKEAWEAKASGRIADANRARNALTGMGFPGEVVDKAVQRYGNKAAPKETKEKDPDEQLNVKLYTSTDAKNTVSMILNGTASEADLREIMSELAADSTAKDPQDAVRKSVQSALKEEYITLFKKGDAKARRMELILLNVVGTSQKTIDNWKKEAQGK